MSKYTSIQGTALVALPEPNLAVIPQQASPQGMSIAQFLAIIRAYWKQIVSIFLVLAILEAVVIKMWPKTYTSTATLIVNADVKDPLAGRDFPVQVITNYVSTQIELMTSPMVLLPVIERLNLMHDKEFTGGFTGSPEALREVVQKNLSAAIAVERGIGGQLLYVSVSAKTAIKAAQLANAVADVYIDQDRRRLNDPASERAQRYSEELAELRAKATIAQDKVTAFRKENGIGDMNSASTGTEVEALDILQKQLLDVQNHRRAQQSKQTGELASGDGPVGSPQLVLQQQLSQLAQLSSTYGPQHPKVLELNAQIALTRQALANDSSSVSALERKYLQAVAEQQEKVTKLRQAQDEGSKLVLELESAKSVYKQALDGFDQIMFQAVANHTNVSVVSQAVPPLRSAKPNKMKLMLGALVAALGVGIGLPMAHGLLWARRVRCRDDVERDFGIAVLAQLDVVPSLVNPA